MQQAGKLNRRIKIQKPGAVRDEIGGSVPGWIDVASSPDVWANIAHKSGLETIKSDAPVSVVQASIRIRYRTDIDASMRVLHGTTVYAIKAVMQDEADRQHVDLVCEVVR